MRLPINSADDSKSSIKQHTEYSNFLCKIQLDHPVVGDDAAGAEVKVAGEADVALLGCVDRRRRPVGQAADGVGAGEPEPGRDCESPQLLVLAASTRELGED